MNKYFRQNPILSFGWVLLLLSVVDGCKTSPVSEEKGPYRTFLEEMNAQTGNNWSWLSDLNLAGQGERGSKYDGTVKPSIAVYLEKDVIFADDEPTKKHIKSVISKLSKAWLGPVPDIGILIKPSLQFSAETDEYDQVIVSTELLRKIENDDQLAAVLAHELAHILLRHNQDKSVYSSMPWTFENAGGLAILIESRYSPSEREVTGLAVRSLSAAWADIAAPAWTRENEREADTLGLDLLIKAGYNPEAFFGVMLKLQAAQINQGKRLQHIADLSKSESLGVYGRNKGVKKTAAASQSLVDFGAMLW